jgi:hypothetical protein
MDRSVCSGQGRTTRTGPNVRTSDARTRYLSPRHTRLRRRRRVVDDWAGGTASGVDEMTNGHGRRNRKYYRKGQRDGDDGDDDDDKEERDRNSSLSLSCARTSRGVIHFVAVMSNGLPTTDKDCEKGDNQPPHISLHLMFLMSSSSCRRLLFIEC